MRGRGAQGQPRKGAQFPARETNPGPHFSEVIKMDIQMVMNMISTLGFPIVVAVALFWYINKQNENHKEEINSLRETIQDNTNILHELKELIKVLAK